MSQSEDYLDNLLNSIGKAKTDNEQIRKDVQDRKKEIIRKRTAVSYDDDFLAATGISEDDSYKKESGHPLLRQAFSEDEFLSEFESELMSENVDDFISAFEMEIDEEERIFQETGELPESNAVVDKLINNIDAIVANTKEEDTNESEDESYEEDSYDIESNFDDESSEDEDVFVNTMDESVDEDAEEQLIEEQSIEEQSVESSEDDTEASEEDDDPLGELESLMSEDVDVEPLLEEDSDSGEESNVMDEFKPDEMDERDEAEFEGSDDEDSELSLDEDFELNILEDDDLMDIQSILDDEGVQLDIDEGAEIQAEPIEPQEKGKGKKGKKEKGKKEKKPLPPAVQKLLLIIFGPPEEEDPNEIREAALKKATKIRKKDPTKLTDEQKALFAETDNPVTDEEIANFEKKKTEKADKKKEEKKKEEKPKKAPKPKKPKKEKEPDNSPKIPLSIIGTFLVLSISIIGVVIIGMTYMGNIRHLSQARELFDSGDYVLAYEKLNGLKLTKEEDILSRNQARLLADVQQCQEEYDVFIAQEMYDLALDSLIKGTGRYEKYKDEAAEYGIQDQYDAYMECFAKALQDKYQLSTEEALTIYNQKNRHYYTIELRKVLIKLGLEEQ